VRDEASLFWRPRIAALRTAAESDVLMAAEPAALRIWVAIVAAAGAIALISLAALNHQTPATSLAVFAAVAASAGLIEARLRPLAAYGSGSIILHSVITLIGVAIAGPGVIPVSVIVREAIPWSLGLRPPAYRVAFNAAVTAISWAALAALYTAVPLMPLAQVPLTLAALATAGSAIELAITYLLVIPATWLAAAGSPDPATRASARPCRADFPIRLDAAIVAREGVLAAAAIVVYAVMGLWGLAVLAAAGTVLLTTHRDSAAVDAENSAITGTAATERRLAAEHVRLRSAATEAQAEARTDPLTRDTPHPLGNRLAFQSDLAEYAAAGVDALLVLGDLAGLKTVNDTLGHPTGDALLRRTGIALATAAARRGDRAYRLGGDEYAVLVASVDEDQISTFEGLVRSSVRYAIASDPALAGVKSYLRTGAAQGHIAPKDGPSLYERADAALTAEHSRDLAAGGLRRGG
jgi:diguanylate cyclase (GGDEF)-like protein